MKITEKLLLYVIVEGLRDFPQCTFKRCVLACYKLITENMFFHLFILISPALVSPVLKTLGLSKYSVCGKKTKVKENKPINITILE